MAYVVGNPKSKKALKDAIAAGRKFACYYHSIGVDLSKFTGDVSIEGPHFPEPHKWYGTATLENGIIVKVK